MRSVVKHFVFSLIALFGATRIIEGFSYGNDVPVLIFAAVTFGVINSFLKPILKLLTLPLNLITLGFSSLLVNASLLYLTTHIVPGLTIAGFYFSGLTVNLPFEYPDLTIPPLDIPFIGTLLLTSIAISLLTVVLGIIFD